MTDEEVLPAMKPCAIQEGRRFKAKDAVVAEARAQGLLAFAHDFPNGTGPKYYLLYSSQGVQEFAARTQAALMLHEVMLDERLTKLTLDIECEEEWNAGLDFEGTVRHIVAEFVEFIQEVHHIMYIDFQNFDVLHASRPGKYSAHIVLSRGLVFADTATLVAVLTQFEWWLIEQERGALSSDTPQTGRKSVLVGQRPVRVSVPATTLSFSGRAPSSPGESLRLCPFGTLFDLHPLRAKNGTLRTHFSTKPGHADDESYRLRRDNLDARGGGLHLVAEFEPEILERTLAQAVRPTFVCPQERVEKRTLVVEATGSLRTWGRFERLLKKAVLDYNHMHLIKCGAAAVTGEGHASKDDLAAMWGRQQRSFYAGLQRALHGSTAPSRSAGGDGGKYACRVRLHRWEAEEVYGACEEILQDYARQARCRHPGLDQVPELVHVKINQQVTALCLVVKKVPCEIVRDENGGAGHTRPAQSTWLKIIVPNGTYTQRCMKERCEGKTSVLRLVDPVLMIQLRRALDACEQVQGLMS